ncbi:hypothetical protein FRC01_010546 [Tulasnella sp. 417]|nr:hypothetical protein FRC01_010546 [Tulasnella sp. 417]
MGAQGSKAEQAEGTNQEAAADYYTLLEVSEDATQDEIRVAMNSFQELQERAWYDSHRASLAPEPDAEAVFEDIRKGAPPPGRRRMNDPGLQAKHIMRFMDASIWKTMDDSDSGFFTIYRNLFTRLAYEENNFNEHPVDYPSFGNSSWTWTGSGPSPDSRSPPEAARKFYNAWLSFSTAKDFVWKELWNVGEAPDRRVRRVMEQENKKARDDARREYNDVVRALVQFVRKRDPRYKTHLESVKQTTASIGAGRSRPVNRNKGNVKTTDTDFSFVEQTWQQTSANAALESEWGTDEQWGAEGEEGEEIECVVCQKTFKSEKAWVNHEQSRKHLKEVEQLKWRLRKENQELGLSTEPQDDEDSKMKGEGVKGQESTMPGLPPEDDSAAMAELSLEDRQQRDSSPTVAGGSLEVDQTTKRAKRKMKGQQSGVQTPTSDSVDTNQQEQEADDPDDRAGGLINTDPSTTSIPASGPSKREKRRAREAAKKAKEAEDEKSDKPEGERRTRVAREKCTTSVAKLISVVEIIKREFPKALRSHNPDASAEDGGGPSLSSESFNLHQYNEVGCKEDLFPPAEEESHEERTERIRTLLEGKNHPTIKRTPYMKITLSREPLPDLADGGIATYQAPVPFKFSKAQKARAKKRAAKVAAATGARGEGLMGDEEDQGLQPPTPALKSIVGNTGSIVL